MGITPEEQARRFWLMQFEELLMQFEEETYGRPPETWQELEDWISAHRNELPLEPRDSIIRKEAERG